MGWAKSFIADDIRIVGSETEIEGESVIFTTAERQTRHHNTAG